MLAPGLAASVDAVEACRNLAQAVDNLCRSQRPDPADEAGKPSDEERIEI